MTRHNLGSAILAGTLGTTIMTVLMYGAPLMGLPPMDLLGALGSVVPLPISPYVTGGLMHLAIGVVLAVIYALILEYAVSFERVLPGPRFARGAVFALLPWLFAITLMGPAITWLHASTVPAEATVVIANPCAAVTSAAAPSPWLLRTMSLMAHLVYGAVVAVTYRRSERS